jgi:carbon monoxide dehydrogenase subunit G
MELSDEIIIPAPRDVVYKSLNDPKILKRCIPGCEKLKKKSDTELDAIVVLKIGPMKARFQGHVVLDPSKAPDSFSLSGEGNGGVAGFAKGGAKVKLTEGGDGTILKYTAVAEPGGKIAQLGSRLILGTAKKLSATFFENFETQMTKLVKKTKKKSAKTVAKKSTKKSAKKVAKKSAKKSAKKVAKKSAKKGKIWFLR